MSLKIQHNVHCKRDLHVRDETETFDFISETRPRRDETFLQNVRDETETFQKQVSRPSRDRDVETETASLILPATVGLECKILDACCPDYYSLPHIASSPQPSVLRYNVTVTTMALLVIA